MGELVLRARNNVTQTKTSKGEMMKIERLENQSQSEAVTNIAWTKTHLWREKQWLRRRLSAAALTTLVCYGLAMSSAMSPANAAPDATWNGPGNNWNNGLNWTPAGVPTNTATFSTAAPLNLFTTANTIINSTLFGLCCMNGHGQLSVVSFDL